MTRHVVITGGTGFLGSRLVRHCLALGDQVTLLVRPQARWERLADVRSQVLVRDASTAAEELFRAPVDLVLHAATCYGRRGEDASAVRAVNHDWPRRLLDAAARSNVGWFVNCDTSLPVGLDPYADWKDAFREHACAAATAGRIGVLNMRLESLFGPGDDDVKFVQRLLHALLDQVPTFDMTAGEQSRDYLDVDDAVAAVATLLASLGQQAPGWLHAGVGRGEPIRIRDFAERLAAITRSSTRLRFGALPYRTGELMEARADLTVLHALGWRPRVSLDDGLARLVAAERTRRRSG